MNIVSSNGGAHAYPTLSAACTCNNVVKYVEYEIVHDNAGIITAVNANLVLENVAFASCSSPVYIEQGFSVRYTTVSNVSIGLKSITIRPFQKAEAQDMLKENQS